MLKNKNYKYESNTKKDSVISVSGIKNKKLECVKMLIVLLIIQCNNDLYNKIQRTENSLSLSDYYDLTSRKLKNDSDLKSAIKQLANLNVTFYDNNGNINRELVFSKIHLRNNYIYFSFNPYIKSKIHKNGRGHRLIEVNYEILVNKDYRKHAQNRLKILLNFALITNVIDCDKTKNGLSIYEKEYFANIIFNTPNSYLKYSKSIDDIFFIIKDQLENM